MIGRPFVVIPLALGVLACNSSSKSTSGAGSASTGSGGPLYAVCAAVKDADRQMGMAPTDKDADPDKAKDKRAKELAECMIDMQEVRTASPASFKKMQACLEEQPKTAGLCVMGLMGSDPALQEQQSKQEKRKEERKKQARADSIAAWADMKTKKFTGKLTTYDGIATNFSIDLGEAFELPEGRSTDSMVMYDFKSPDPDIFGGPSLSIRQGYGAPDLDTDAALEEQIHRKVTKKEKLSDGHVIVSQNDDGSSVDVKVVKKVGDYGSIHCEASLYGEDMIGAKDKLVPWLVKMCSSLSAKNGN